MTGTAAHKNLWRSGSRKSKVSTPSDTMSEKQLDQLEEAFRPLFPINDLLNDDCLVSLHESNVVPTSQTGSPSDNVADLMRDQQKKAVKTHKLLRITPAHSSDKNDTLCTTTS